MNYIPSAGPLSILPLAYYHEERPTVGHKAELRVGQVHFDRMAASDGLDKQVQLHLWFEQPSTLPDSIIDKLEARCLISKEFALVLECGTLFGKMTDVQVMPTSRAIEVVRLTFTLIAVPPESQGPFTQLVQWVKKFFTFS